ncbi:MAG: hypothetical protein CL582_01060 [Alteromonadaceae bacterium]|nr:hypothetical protein [Alteromonadaceae bacterium]
MMPNPTHQNKIEERMKSDKFLAATFMLFLVRIFPDSRQRNPACMMKTSIAEMRIQPVSKMCP